jgi:hypothetical protein
LKYAVLLPLKYARPGQFEIRRRRSLISAQGSSLREPWGPLHQKRINPERVRQPPNPFRVNNFFGFVTQGCRWRSNHWAEISERLRRISNWPGRAYFKLDQDGVFFKLDQDGVFSTGPGRRISTNPTRCVFKLDGVFQIEPH